VIGAPFECFVILRGIRVAAKEFIEASKKRNDRMNLEVIMLIMDILVYNDDDKNDYLYCFQFQKESKF
jgi:hypothetical protein